MSGNEQAGGEGSGAVVDPEFLAQIPILGGMPQSVLGQIVNTVQVMRVVAGDQLFGEGELAQRMFIVREGELEVCKRGRNGAEFCLAVLRRGDCVGEMSLIDIQPRSATVRALGPGELYVLDQTAIAKLARTDLEVYTLLVLNIAREISRRLRNADQVLVDMGIAVQNLWAEPSTAGAAKNTRKE